MRLPTADEINVYNTLDERWAVEHFLGKSLAQAEALFREDHGTLSYMEDLMWMGPRAFCIYVLAAINYIKSDAAVGDWEVILGFSTTLSFRLDCEEERREIQPVLPELRSAVDYILDNFPKFAVVPDGDLARPYCRIRAQLGSA